ncbi:MAG: hypothetical protein JW726_03335 [Anaerolineales bacterium]|nr:hypothetical protein [Anaerolineales bacterium]
MNATLPAFLKPFFWDCDFATLTFDEKPDFIICRLLQEGSWEALNWLRAEMGDAALRRWIEQHRGAGLKPRQLRLWEAVLGLSHAKVSLWVNAATTHPWEGRLVR